MDRIVFSFFALIYAFLVSWDLANQHKTGREIKQGKMRYDGFLAGYYILYLPLFFLMLLPFWVFYPEVCFQRYVDILVSIFLYHLVLLPFLPLLRRVYSARCCGVLWLLPSLLYLLCMRNNSFVKPVLVLPVWGEWGPALGYVWLGGCIAVLAWKIGGHLLFRRRILQEAEPVKEQRVLDIWKEERSRVFSSQENWDLVISLCVRTPLSIGIFRGTTTVVLPDKEYTDDELKLIFRHELIHISYRDGANKFFLAFCTAMCWFNPLMWISMRKSAEDFELSCDESVLLNEGDTVRQQYAGLILDTAGEEKGFTTCLAASASALRYRLKNILRKRKLRSGALLVFAMFLLLTATVGMLALGYDYTTAWGAVAPQTGDGQMLPEAARWGVEEVQCVDAQALQNYLEELQVCRLFGTRVDNQKIVAQVLFQNGVQATFRADTMTLTGDGMERVTYYFTETVDWTYLKSLFN